jgi:hypothetical protein
MKSRMIDLIRTLFLGSDELPKGKTPEALEGACRGCQSLQTLLMNEQLENMKIWTKQININASLLNRMEIIELYLGIDGKVSQYEGQERQH